MEKDVLNPWFALFKDILDMPCPPDLSTPTEETDEINRRDKSIFWKIKSLTAKITYRAFVKYSKPTHVEQKPHITAFAKQFKENYSIGLLESHLQILMSRKTQFVGSKCLSFAIKFLGAATKQKNTMNKIKPFVEDILYNNIVPLMFITMKDMKQF